MYTYKTKGTCAKEIKFSIEKEIIKELVFVGGCPGNLIGLSSLVEGMKVEEVIEKLEFTKCGSRSTSCPDQLAKALKNYV